MSKLVILDTGPLVALLQREEEHHEWTRQLIGTMHGPLVTCEAVVTEACFLLARIRNDAPTRVLETIERGLAAIQFSLSSEMRSVRQLMQKYASIPMSLADACLVRMTEIIPESVVLTFDRHFRIYKRHRRHEIRTLIPDGL